MSRSPWREALDGQIQILRTLRQKSSIIHLARTTDIFDLERLMPDQYRRAKVQELAGERLAETLSDLVRAAEPIYLSHDIREQVLSHVLMQNKYPDGIVTERLEASMLPIPNGLVWFGPRGLVFRDNDLPLRPGVVDSEESARITVMAVYFGEDIELIIQPSGIPGEVNVHIANSGPPNPETGGMGAVAFVDARLSGFLNMTRELGDHLVPVPLGGWPFGLTLRLHVKTNKELPRARGTDLEGTNALVTLVNATLYRLFLLMHQEIIRWGGVGLNREERRDAEREKLRPRVQLITWRKAQYKYPEGHIPVPKNWSCRWSVRPHYRRYKSGKVIAIKSYIKGPADRPFRERVTQAHQVIR